MYAVKLQECNHCLLLNAHCNVLMLLLWFIVFPVVVLWTLYNVVLLSTIKSSFTWTKVTTYLATSYGISNSWHYWEKSSSLIPSRRTGLSTWRGLSNSLRLTISVLSGDDKADKRRATFLAVIGPAPYKLLRSLITPVKPKEKKYDELVTTLTEHYSTIPSEVMQRFHFNSRARKAGEMAEDAQRSHCCGDKRRVDAEETATGERPHVRKNTIDRTRIRNRRTKHEEDASRTSDRLGRRNTSQAWTCT